MNANDFSKLSEREIMYGITNNEENLINDTSFEDFLSSLKGKTQKIALAVLELYKRDKMKQSPRRVTSSADAACIMASILCDSIVEQAWIIPLNSAGRVLDKPIRISIGGMTTTLIDSRVVMKELINICATAFILVHNHPSGNMKPSMEDERVTENIKKAGEIMNIKLLDHIIVGRNESAYYSFNDEGKI